MLTSWIRSGRGPLGRTASRGASLIEILVSILIMTFGVLGLAALQAKAQKSELESYQRQQALILVEDMASRIAANKNQDNSLAASYVTTAPLGTGDTSDCSAPTTNQQRDSCEWSGVLKGSSATQGSSKLGAMINARGCVTEIIANLEYRVDVVWQGLNPTVAPASTCGQDLYDSEDTRRAVSMTVRMANLSAP